MTDSAEKTVGRQTQPGRILTSTVTAVSVALSLYVVLYVTRVFTYLNLPVLTYSHRAIFLAFLIALAFLILPAKGKRRTRLAWYDILLILVGVAGPLYGAFFWEKNAPRYFFEDFYAWEYVLGFITIGVILEITRRAIGVAMPLIASLFLLHAFFAQYFPGFLNMRETGLGRAFSILLYSTEGVYGLPLDIASTVIVLFVLFGELLFVTPAGKFFMDLALSLLGYVRGGPAKVAVVASALFGTMSGSPMANVAVTGAFTIPLMKRTGYSANFAGAVESVASTGGQIMPPVMGATAFVIAAWLRIPYWSVAVAAFIPALLYYFAVYQMVDAEAVRLGLRGIPRAECPSLKKTLRDGWPSIVPLLVLLYFLGVLQYTAQYSALFAIAALILINLLRKKTRPGPSQFVTALKNTGKGVLGAGSACACAGVIIGSLLLSQLGIKLTDIIVNVSGESMWLLLILAAVTSFILGMGVPGLAAYIMVAVLVAPALQKFGIAPLPAHLFIFYWSMTSFFTPPVAAAVFVAVGISGGSITRTGLISMKLAILSYILPFMFVTEPALIFQGPVERVALVFLAALAGVVLLSWGLSGVALRPASWLQRGMFLAGGLLLMTLTWATALAGLGIGAVALLLQLRDKALMKAAGISSGGTAA